MMGKRDGGITIMCGCERRKEKCEMYQKKIEEITVTAHSSVKDQMPQRQRDA
jgi:hypothetical protein